MLKIIQYPFQFNKAFPTQSTSSFCIFSPVNLELNSILLERERLSKYKHKSFKKITSTAIQFGITGTSHILYFSDNNHGSDNFYYSQPCCVYTHLMFNT